MLNKIGLSSYPDKYTFITVWRFSFEFRILGLLQVVCWNMVAWEGGPLALVPLFFSSYPWLQPTLQEVLRASMSKFHHPTLETATPWTLLGATGAHQLCGTASGEALGKKPVLALGTFSCPSEPFTPRGRLWPVEGQSGNLLKHRAQGRGSLIWGQERNCP